MMKKCYKCGIDKEWSTLYFETHSKAGNLRSTCRKCRNKNPRKNKKERNRWRVDRRKQLTRDFNNRQLIHCRINLISRINPTCAKCFNNLFPFSYQKTICDNCYKQKKRMKASVNLKRRLHSDPAFKLRVYVSNAVNRALRTRSKSKNGKSVMSHISYTINELVSHLEFQFEPWMSWDNHGSPRKGERMWHVDHIIPKKSSSV